MRKTAFALITVALVLTACADGDGPGPAGGGPPGSAGGPPGNGNNGNQAGGRVDPRDGGLDVAMGEWAITLESDVIRPGRVTFVVTNRGTIPHGFEIEAEGDDSSGPGSGRGLKAETNLLQPGDTARISLALPPGIYKVECFVDNHDDLGMEGFLDVRQGAPFVGSERNGVGGADAAVSIEAFAFSPADLAVDAGTEVTWTNDDPAPHTVTAEDGSFDSGTLEVGQTFSVAIEGNGPVSYRCEIHPEMLGTITVR
jgi:plastocyanin